MFWGRHPQLAGRVLQGLRVPQKSTEGTPGSLGLLYWGKLWRLVRNVMATSGRGVVVSRRGIAGAGRHYWVRRGRKSGLVPGGRRTALSLSQLRCAFPTPPPAPGPRHGLSGDRYGGGDRGGPPTTAPQLLNQKAQLTPELSDSRERSTDRGRNEGIPEHLEDPRSSQCSRRQPPTLGLPARAGTPDAWGKGPRKGKWPLLLLIIGWMGAGCHGQYSCR